MNAFHRQPTYPNAGRRYRLRHLADFSIRTFVLWNLKFNQTPLLLVSMSIRDYLDRTQFDGETIRQMGIAFEIALASLGATPGCDDPIRTALAQRIIVLAQAGERDPERLCEGALQVGSPAVHRDSAGVQPER